MFAKGEIRIGDCPFHSQAWPHVFCRLQLAWSTQWSLCILCPPFFIQRQMSCLVWAQHPHDVNGMPYSIDHSPQFPGQASNTQVDYKCCCCCLWNFLLIVGTEEAFISMLIMLVFCPNGVTYPSIPTKFIHAFVLHQFDDFCKPLVLYGIEMKDFLVNPILCSSKVNYSDAFQQFWAALSLLHCSYGQDGNYSGRCEMCFNRFKACTNLANFSPCVINCPNCNFCNGNTCDSNLTALFKKELHKHPKALKY